MEFLDRKRELAALSHLDDGGLAVVWGRRRIGKTRLLLEWCENEGGVYTVADQSAPETQRAYFARAIARAIPGFDEVTYPDWDRLLGRLAGDAATRRFHGPIVIDELPYLVQTSPELPSILQRWIDHDCKRARLRVALAGSSQRMMHGLVLSHDAPLYGRAKAVVALGPLSPEHVGELFGGASTLEHWCAWGGVPRYLELAASRKGSILERIATLVLDPLGPLFSEPDRLLLEEMPPAIEMRPVLDAIGAGAHRLSEIAGRIGRPATSLAKPLERLMSMGMICREAPYGEPERGGKRSLYKIDDPFLRMWFRVVAPNRAALIAGTSASRRAALDPHWPALLGQAWEEICRLAIPSIAHRTLRKLGPWRTPSRWWHKNEPEWNLVADAVEAPRTLVGEARRSGNPKHECARLAKKPLPPVSNGREIVRAVFLPNVPRGTPRMIEGVHVVTLDDLF